MTAAPPPATSPWTCPFCALLCDDLNLQLHNSTPLLRGGECHKAQAALTQFDPAPKSTGPLINGQASSLPQAIHAAAALLSESQQPLFAGLGTDVAGARALYRLACRTGAICDAGTNPSWMQGLTALQDRGAFTTTLAEVRARADLIVLVGATPWAHTPRLLTRLGLTHSSQTSRQLLLWGAAPGDAQALAQAGLHASVAVESVPMLGDIFDSLAQLQLSLRQGARQTAVSAPLTAPLSARLQTAHYAVFVANCATWPVHGALGVEALNNIVAQLNQQTRAAALWLSGDASTGTTNQVFSWLSGLPLRTRAGPAGLEHEPLTFETTRLLQDRAVDSLLWVANLDAAAAPPAADLPRVVLGPTHLNHGCHGPGTVFIPVSTPGLGSAGHLMRTDGVVLMPLFAAWDDGLPSVADVANAVLQEMGPP